MFAMILKSGQSKQGLLAVVGNKEGIMAESRQKTMAGAALATKTARLLTVFEAEAMTGRKVATWRRDIFLKRITFVKLGKRHVRIPIEVVEAMINAGWHQASCR